ncbi:MAG: hypothetical protein H3C62_02380 [Gemmatimonadaceae bacterium]|nr:hypothetical protein [Gemmatimonadaceae bacterium]
MARIPPWLVLTDGGVRCLRCGVVERMPSPMPASAFGKWCEFQGAMHAGCQDTGRTDVPPRSPAEWLAGPDTGVSSRAIYRHMSGLPVDPACGAGYPHDPDDFGRCYRLLAIAPEWRARIAEMSAYGAAWAALSVHWDELTALHEAELAGTGDREPSLHRRIRQLVESARAA